MSAEAWKYIYASVVGTSHIKIDMPCQDSSACAIFNINGSQVLVAVVSDGAGSAQRADVGSSLACSLFVQEMEALFENEGGVHDITREFVESWLIRFHHEVDLRAEGEGLTSRDFACTLLATVIGRDCAAFMQIGDGAIVILSQEEPDDYSWVFWPQQGQYANETYFATDAEAAGKLAYDFIERRIDEVAIFTDGIQGLALHYESQTAHIPFFRPVFEWLRPTSAEDSEKLSASLATYLNSPKVNEYTDDDKTLILATRRPKYPPPVPVEDSHDSQSDAATL